MGKICVNGKVLNDGMRTLGEGDEVNVKGYGTFKV